MGTTKWGIATRWLYKALRPKLVEVVKDSENTVDDVVLKVLDVLAGVEHGSRETRKVNALK